MNIWKCKDWEKYYSSRSPRGGIKTDFDKGVDSEVKNAIKNMLVWLRKEYSFPVRLRIYIKETDQVKARDGDLVYDLFFWPDSRDDEPYIKFAAGDYAERKKQTGKDNALATILIALAGEITHYFQWLNGLEFDEDSKQAKLYGKKVMRTYFDTVDHL